MLRGSSVFAAVVALLLLGKGSPGPAPSGSSASSGANEVPRVRTGESDLLSWFNGRFGRALEALTAMGVPDPLVRPVALSIVAQWSHETGKGRAEFCYNLGGWHARTADKYFTARDVQTGPARVRWTAYPDLTTAVRDQIQRLSSGRYSRAWALLLEQPTEPAWIFELGRKAYFVPPPGRTEAEHAKLYAQAWAANRAELGRLAA